METTPRDAPLRRVLLMFAGNLDTGRIARREHAGPRIARALAPIAAQYLFYANGRADPADPDAKVDGSKAQEKTDAPGGARAPAGKTRRAIRRHAMHAERGPLSEVRRRPVAPLLAELETIGPKVRVHAMPVKSPGDVHDPTCVAAWVQSFLDEPGKGLFRNLERAALASTEFVVSIANGTPTQWTCLIDALLAREARVSVARVTSGGEVRSWRPPAGQGYPTRDVEMLSRAPAAWNVLLTGPTGAGKSELARRLHDAWSKSSGRSGPIVAVNVAAVPTDLIEAELFGHAKGAYTGAVTERKGRLEEADKGTLFLDEIGDLPLAAQAKLLVALDVDKQQKRAVQRLGDGRASRVDVRLVLATNRDLATMLREGRFREDLLARIATYHLRLPPLAALRHRLLVELHRHLGRVAALYLRAARGLVPGTRTVRFAIDHAARTRLHDFVFDEGSPWSANHRDVMQASERLATRAWDGFATSRRSRSAESGVLTIKIELADVEAEVAELERRWSSGAPRGAPRDTDGLGPPDPRVDPASWSALARLDRMELSILLGALDAARGNQAEAWRRIRRENSLPGPTGDVQNPTNAFRKRLERFASALRDAPGAEPDAGNHASVVAPRSSKRRRPAR
jgi:sigma54-dependent transcription regulator